MFLSITGATADNKLAKFQEFESEADADAHALEYSGFVISDPGGNQEFWVVDMVAKTVVIDTSAETSVTTERAWTALREKRDELLAETDWWAGTDLTMTDAQTAYRQALRDLPDNTTDPENPVWPTPPA
tara:strand:- start:639 stop:1025 length:387 start_codon:yes stop_codon:yes gene_type:complete